MTNEEQTKIERRKILVVDDLAEVNIVASQHNDLFDYVMPIIEECKYGPRLKEFSYTEVERLLKEVPYKAILLDGDLHLRSEGIVTGEFGSDGSFISYRLRNGNYGELNKQTPIYSISSTFGMIQRNFISGELFKPNNERNLDRVMQELKKDGVLE